MRELGENAPRTSVAKPPSDEPPVSDSLQNDDVPSTSYGVGFTQASQEEWTIPSHPFSSFLSPSLFLPFYFSYLFWLFVNCFYALLLLFYRYPSNKRVLAGIPTGQEARRREP